MLAFMGAVSACVNDDYVTDDVIKTKVSKEGLTISPTVSESSLVIANTRADDEDPLKEKFLNTLDVFVEPATKSTVDEEDVYTGTGSFMLQYHLPFEGGSVKEAAENLLANSWRQQGLEMGKYYNVYVAVNNNQTSAVQDLSTFKVADLKALVYDEIDAGVATADKATHDITGRTGLIYKQYAATSADRNALSSDKEFMMDGFIEGWTPKADTQSQVFDVTMNRAAAKIVLNLKFPKSFTDELKEDGLKLGDTPAWKFNNFAFSAPVFDPKTFDKTATTPPAVEVYNSADNFISPNGYTYVENKVVEDDKEVDKSYYVSQIVTYTYPNSWDAGDYITKAPSMVVSVRYYTENGKEFTEHYYRIPLVKNTVTDIKRNYIYVINANIKTRGSESHEDVDPIDDLEYEVLPWNDETNEAAIHSDAESIQHYYFKVNPKVYTLRGDKDQSVILTYLKAENTKVNWKLFTYDDKGNETEVVANDDPNAIRAWFYNASGDFTTTYNDNEPRMNWSNDGPTPMGVTIKQSDEGTSGSSGTITVTSHALNNKAIKYIRLRVFLDEESTFQDDKETMYEDIVIRHFPTDNIQNIVGSWSSYIPAGSGVVRTLDTEDLAQAEAWKEEYGVDYTTQEVSKTEYLSYSEYSSHAGETGYLMTVTEVERDAFLNAVPLYNRQTADSQEDAIADSGEGHYYYWGTGVTTVATYIRYRDLDDYTYDYTTRNGNRYDLHKYSNYHTVSYTHTYNTIKYVLKIQPTIDTGSWVDWIDDAGQTYSEANVKYTHASIFTAKVFNNGIIRAIEPNRTGYGTTYSPYQYTYRIANSGNQGGYYTYAEETSWGSHYTTAFSGGMTNLTNNHMYVIQISSTSANYIMGRPKLNNNLSNDDVVSPAFMIASQLGAVTGTEDAATAAEHCSRYVEVTPGDHETATYYTGWRLPTPDELNVIVNYQQGTINGVTIDNVNYQAMTPVLTGRDYWSLTGETYDTGIGNDWGPYLRCVRDLTAAEVEALNGFDAIVEKYGTGHIN